MSTGKYRACIIYLTSTWTSANTLQLNYKLIDIHMDKHLLSQTDQVLEIILPILIINEAGKYYLFRQSC